LIDMFEAIRALNQNPIFAKEQQVHRRIHSQKKFAMPSWTGYLSILLLPVLLGFLLNLIKVLTPDDIKYFFIGSIVLQVLYYCYRGLSHSWNLIAREREMKSYDSLISTVMSPNEIVKGKFWSSFYPLALEIIALLPVFLLTGLLLRIKVLCLAFTFIFTILFAAFFSMAGLYFSARANNTVQARNNSIRLLAFMSIGTIIASFFISLFITLMTPILWKILGLSASRTGILIISAIPSTLLYTINPLANISSILVIEFIPRSTGSFEWASIGFLTFSFIIYTVIGIILYRKTVKRIRMIPE